LRRRAVDAQRRPGLVRQQLAELLADRDQRAEILDIFPGERIFDHRDGGGAAGRRRDGPAHLHPRLLDHGDDLANDGAHCMTLSLTRWRGMAAGPTMRVSPCNRSAARWINPSANSLRALRAPASSADAISPSS